MSLRPAEHWALGHAVVSPGIDTLDAPWLTIKGTVSLQHQGSRRFGLFTASTRGEDAMIILQADREYQLKTREHAPWRFRDGRSMI